MTITRSDAESIAKKLNASIQNRTRHQQVIVWYQNQVVARYGIRRGSNRDSGHGHIPGQLHISPRETKRLAICTLDRDTYFAILRQKNLL
jgi:hypothetical protein